MNYRDRAKQSSLRAKEEHKAVLRDFIQIRGVFDLRMRQSFSPCIRIKQRTKNNAIIAIGAVVIGGAVTYSLWNHFHPEETPSKKAAVPLKTGGTSTLRQFDLSKAQLQKMISDFQYEMDVGLSRNGGKTSLKMLHSFVGKPTGNEKGAFYALDLGGTNFRVLKLDLLGNGKLGASEKQQFEIPQEAMRGGAHDLFDFIAGCVERFVLQYNGPTDPSNTIKLGFTFSFPVNQTSLAAGTLIKWTKGFTTEGVVGRDVVALLSEHLERRRLHIEVVALVNDTVGTLVAHGYTDVNTELGVILGTGTNAAYAEYTHNIKALESPFHREKMIINIEWGAFGDVNDVLPLTSVDKKIDQNSVNPHNQKFEKTISGLYLGEIARLLTLELAEEGTLFVGTDVKTSNFIKKDSFPTATVSQFLMDNSDQLSDIERVMLNQYGLSTSRRDRALLKEVSLAVVTRAARLSATAIAAILHKINRLSDATVAIDGSVYEKIPGFKVTMENTIRELYPGSSVKTELARDGSGNGAAIIAATV
ncbi:hypothetical protein PROFUN_01655 [Planoprotostelium fungivorum]|uniref:Phosphotransferase n=1 Tax=Planoprotostelium fungivorum TaxID=1890364 RepID=A0A2P6MW69_9EUKA|nr:hypothetical protein PROFUN_01655 [Planoprotostelium fungivorum]